LLLQRPGYNNGEVRTGAWIVGLGAEALLVIGGSLGGTNVFVYGVRVLMRADTPVRDALVPGHAERARASDARMT
jgi:hypothetical protein